MQALGERMSGNFCMSDVGCRDDQTIELLLLDHDAIVGITVGDLETIADDGKPFGAQVGDSDQCCSSIRLNRRDMAEGCPPTYAYYSYSYAHFRPPKLIWPRWIARRFACVW